MPSRNGPKPYRGMSTACTACGWPTWRPADPRPHTGGLVDIETRYRYNPEVKSLVAMVPAVIPLLLIMIPAMLTALSVVREKELGSIVNLYVTPVTRLEFLLGKQLPYIGLAMVNFFLLALLAVSLFRVPIKGDIPPCAWRPCCMSPPPRPLGLLISTFMRSQVAALFGTAVLHHPAFGQLFRHDQSGLFAGRSGAPDRSDLSHRPFPRHQPGHIFQGIGICRPPEGVSRTCTHHRPCC